MCSSNVSVRINSINWLKLLTDTVELSLYSKTTGYLKSKQMSDGTLEEIFPESIFLGIKFLIFFMDCMLSLKEKLSEKDKFSEDSNSWFLQEKIIKKTIKNLTNFILQIKQLLCQKNILQS
tara:strand:+ start:363 stop:725 length:363 start_codon:yes stop_codon:yes gene_type:complete